MALKPIDNALPLPHEAIILGVNKENKTAASLPPADPIIDYISSGNLEPISDPESKIHGKSSVFGDQLLDSTNNAFDNLLLQLLLKASQDKRFVCEEADRALNAMVKSMTPLPFLNKLRPYVSHCNPRVRAKAAITISNCLQDGPGRNERVWIGFAGSNGCRFVE
ncbi:hypothetical protein OIU77_030760 [Salix suchowensis]|uniref:Uncharacterized protein n=1 Tax=Salix suchowensis TaxID=1278906 RepID=A0ABQ9BGL1_9ROSI|nr:hypothetical protein OIU77_030760 [Salix suchowensis]